MVTPHVYDAKGQPITLETYAFDPTEVLTKSVTLEQYLEFILYSIEFRTLMIEQISDNREKQYLLENQDHDLPDGYGNQFIIKLCCIRDLQGVGFKHICITTKKMLQLALDIALPYYPEYLGKSYMVHTIYSYYIMSKFVVDYLMLYFLLARRIYSDMVNNIFDIQYNNHFNSILYFNSILCFNSIYQMNVPWIFETLWSFMKALLDERTISKFALCGTGSGSLDEILKEIPYESLASTLGGALDVDNWGFEFDTFPGGW